jgi:hypothetical protein
MVRPVECRFLEHLFSAPFCLAEVPLSGRSFATGAKNVAKHRQYLKLFLNSDHLEFLSGNFYL